MTNVAGQHISAHSGFKRGFTIVELLVVIVVIGILAAITIVSYTGISQKAIASSLKSDLKNAVTTLEIDKASNNAELYPSSDSSANSGKGLVSSNGASISYVYYDSINEYCLQETIGSISYYVTSFDKTPSEGQCPARSFALGWGGTAEDNGYSVAYALDGGYIMAGYQRSYSVGNDDVFVAKFDSKGDLSWSKIWGGAAYDNAYSVTATSDGGCAVTGYTESYGAGNKDVFLVKYDASGNLSWSKTWGGIAEDIGYSIKQTTDGGYIVTGQTYSFGAGDRDIFLVRYDSSGNVLWDATWGRANGDWGWAAIEDSNGDFVVSGVSNSGSNNDAVLIKFDSGGSFMWNKTWGGTSAEAGYSVIQSSDGGYAMSGVTSGYGAGGMDVFLAKYDSNGNLSWNKTWGGASDDRNFSLVMSDDDGYALAGNTLSFGAGSYDAYLAKFDSVGNLSWSVTWGSTSTDSVTGLIKTLDGGYAMTGITRGYGLGLNDAILLKYDSSGSMAGCSSPMCQNVSATVGAPTVTTGTPSATISDPAATTNTPTVSESSPTVVLTEIVAPQ